MRRLALANTSSPGAMRRRCGRQYDLAGGRFQAAKPRESSTADHRGAVKIVVMPENGRVFAADKEKGRSGA
jgi:hypothetical protein